MGHGDYASAAEEFQKAVQMNPSDPQAAIRIQQAVSAYAKATADKQVAKEGKPR
jgi:hypothetical protein